MQEVSISSFLIQVAHRGEKDYFTHFSIFLIIRLKVFYYLQSVQIKRQKYYTVGVLFLIFALCAPYVFTIFLGFYLHKLKRAYKTFKTV